MRAEEEVQPILGVSSQTRVNRDFVVESSCDLSIFSLVPSFISFVYFDQNGHVYLIF
jgi:hypothetical protein